MPQLDYSKCVVCDAYTDGAIYGPLLPDGTPDSSKEHIAVPVCIACAESGRISKWWEDARKEIQNSDIGIMTSEYTGNIAVDLTMIRKIKIQNERMDDGVCPNGCALLRRIDANTAECNICKFVLHQNTPINFTK